MAALLLVVHDIGLRGPQDVVLGYVPCPLPVCPTGTDGAPQLPVPVDDAQSVTLWEGHHVPTGMVVVGVGGDIARGAQEWQLRGGGACQRGRTREC